MIVCSLPLFSPGRIRIFLLTVDHNHEGTMMRTRKLILMIVVALGAASCTSEDAEVAQSAKEFTTAHPHPFDLTATDSSLVGKYTRRDTLRDYHITIWKPDADGVLVDYVRPSDSIDYPMLIPDMTYEWNFDVIGLDSLMDGCTIVFADGATVDAEFSLIWKYRDGDFEPLLYTYK